MLFAEATVETMKPILRRLLGLVLALVFGALALSAVVIGVTLDGKEAPAIQCTRSAPRPDAGGPYYESTVTTGERTWFPLGINCTYDSPDDAIGPQTVVNSNWLATFVWLASSGAAIFGMVLLLKPARPSRVLLAAP
jgi:hypothetical protein